MCIRDRAKIVELKDEYGNPLFVCSNCFAQRENEDEYFCSNCESVFFTLLDLEYYFEFKNFNIISNKHDFSFTKSTKQSLPNNIKES